MRAFKPNHGFQVNRNHWAGRNLSYCYLFDQRGSGVELIKRESYIPNASSTIPLSSQSHRFGRATASDGTAARFINAGVNSSWCQGSSNYTIAALVKCTAVPASNTNGVIMYESTPTSSTTRFNFRLLTNTGSTIINWQYVFRVSDAGGATVVSFGSGVRVAAGDEAVLMATFLPGAQALYVNGVLEGTASVAGTVQNTAPANRQFLVDQSSNAFNGMVSAVFVWNDASRGFNLPQGTFNATQAEEFADNPFAMFMPPTRRPFTYQGIIPQTLDVLIDGAAM